VAEGLVAKVKFIGDAKDLLKATKKIQGDVGRLSSSFRKLGNFAKVAIGAFAVTRVIGFLKQSVRAADDAAKAQRRLDAVFTASGAKSLKLFKDLNAQTREISLSFGIDAGEVVKVQERLSAYLEAFAFQGAEGAEKFKEVTKLAFDIDAAGLASAEAAAKTLGQVLLEPLDAANRLKKLGIQLTNDEIESIKELVAQGRIAEAQNVILQAISRQVGGVAEANASALDRLNAAIKSIVGSIGILFLPLLEPIANGLAYVAEKVQNWTEANEDFVSNLKLDVVAWIKQGWAQIKNWADETGLAQGATAAFNQILESLGFTAEDTAGSIDGLTDSTKEYKTAVSELNPITDTAVKRKLALYEITESLKNIFKNLATAIGDAAGTIGGALFTAFAQFKSSKIVSLFINQLTDLINIAETLSIALGGVIRQLGNFVSLLAAVLTGNISEAKKVFDRIVADAEDTVKKLNVLLGRAREIAASMTGSNTVPASSLPFGGASIIPTPKTKVTTPNIPTPSNIGSNSSTSKNSGKTIIKELPTGVKSGNLLAEPNFDVGSFRMADNSDLVAEQEKQTAVLNEIADSIEKQRFANASNYTVNVQTLQPTAQTGKLIVDAIKQFEDRSGGSGFRTAMAL
jgi:hypothetical protein